MKIIKEIGRNPQIDWVLILFFTVGAILALALSGYYLYNAVTSGKIQGKPVKSTSYMVDEKIISSVITRFHEREDITKKTLEEKYSGAPDPSL